MLGRVIVGRGVVAAILALVGEIAIAATRARQQMPVR